ncbi:MAG: thymidine phosphorylase [candidate division WOR-3 bacterium]
MGINFLDILYEKRNGNKLSEKEIEFLVNGYTKGVIPDYQFSAFLMAVYFRGMDFDETTFLTKAMLHSGTVLDLSDIDKPKIDKHSTGGVGDKVSLILAPLVASCGICVPMISGRSLGHTGGTLDKLESIPGFRTNLTLRDFKRQLKKIGIAIIGQTEEIAPADKKIYSLRDVTATVDSIPLITASIMSKKLAEDLDGLVLDVKFGNGAFMKEYKKAKALAHTLVNVGKRAGLKTVAVLTDMNNPLGEYIGNSLEIIEAIETLKGRGPKDLMQVIFSLGVEMLRIAGIKGGEELLKKKINDGSALDKFKELVKCQNGNPDIINDYGLLPVARNRFEILADSTGYIHFIDNHALGFAATKLGAGRLKKDDKIDHSCGFRVKKKIGDFVKRKDVLIEIFSDDRVRFEEIRRETKKIFKIMPVPVRSKALIREVIK